MRHYNRNWASAAFLFTLLFFPYTQATVNCGRCRPVEEQNAPGVGLSFSMGYGTAAIRFLNGTILDVPKVEGSSAYVMAMEELASEAANISVGRESNLRGIDLNLPQATSSGYHSVKQFFQQLFYPTQQPTIAGDKWTAALTEMAISLRNAVDAAHEMKYSDVWISIPDFALKTDESFSRRFSLATERAGMSVGRRLYAGHAAMRELDDILNCNDIYLNETYHEPDVDCEYHNGVRITNALSVDYSDQSLGLTLHTREDGMFFPDLSRHDELVDLGARKSTASGDADGYWANVKNALLVYSQIPDHEVDHIVLSGDRAANSKFLAVMQDVFKSNDKVKGYQRDPDSHVFAPARQACREARIAMMGGYDGCIPGPSCPRGEQELPWDFRWHGPDETERESVDGKKTEL